MYHGHVYLHRICYQIVAHSANSKHRTPEKRSVNYIHLSFGICKNRVTTEIWDSKHLSSQQHHDILDEYVIFHMKNCMISTWYFRQSGEYQLTSGDKILESSSKSCEKPTGSFKVIDLDQQVSGSNTPWEESLIDVQQVDDILLFFYHKILKRW